MQKKPEKNNAAGVASADDITEFKKIVPSNHNTKGVGRKPSLFQKTLDSALSPLWVRLPRHKGRLVFHALGFVLGRTKLYSTLGASYIRFLNYKEAA